MEIDNANRNEIERILSRANRGQELEVRFGKFVFNKTTRKSNFVSEVEVPFFYNLKNALNKQGFEKITKKTKDFSYRQHEGTIKRTVHEDGKEEYMLKNHRKMYRDVYDYDFRVSLASEQIMSHFPSSLDKSSYDLLREKERTSYIIPIGRIDMTIVKEDNRLKYEVEMELKNDGSVTYDTMMAFVKIVLQIKQNNHFVISNKERKTIVDEYKGIFDLKGVFFIGAQPETLQKNGISNLYKEKYSVTDKADGDRAFMMINKDKQVYFIDNNVNSVYKTDLSSALYTSTVIDGEIVHIDNKIYFLAFDVIAYNGKDLRGNMDYKLATRLNRLNHIIGTIKSNEKYNVQMKKFYYNNVFLGSEVLLDNVAQKPYKNDGLIFTPMDEPYPMVKKWSKLLKWKPAELNTIDFYSKKTDSGNWTLYVQSFGNTQGPVGQQGVDGQQNRTTIVPFDVEKLCSMPQPIQEMTYQTTFDDNLIDPTTNEPFQTDTVIEYMWDKERNKFVPLRTRWDKTANPSKHGNFSTVACNIWNNIHNPVEKELLFKFTTHATQSKEDFFFERMRRFHNKVKENLYNKYTKNCEYLLELCSGKGGDLHKWLHNNVNNVYGYDISQKAVSECRRRVQNTVNQTQLNWKPNYLFYEADLCQSDTYLKLLQDNKEKYDVICCQFGVHYFFQSQSTFNSLIDILQNALKENGCFIVTFMDKQQVDNLMENQSTVIRESENEIAYYIKQYSKDQKPFGNQLRIVMSGNNVLKEGSNEYLVDFNTLRNSLQEKGLSVTEDVMFKDVYNEFVHQYKLEPLSNIEKEISFLNRLCVFRKENKPQTAVDSEFVTVLNKTPEHVNRKTLFNFDTIQIQQNGVSVYKVSSKYDIVDIINCIDYKYYKNRIDDKPITCFEDITSTFDELGIQFNPVFITDPLNDDSVPTAKQKKALEIKFTYHKHIVEKKNTEGDIETTEYDNWYVVLYKNKLVNKSPTSASTLPKQSPTNQVTPVSPTNQVTPVSPTNHTESEKTYAMTIKKDVRNQQILLELQANPKTTLKVLKGYLGELGLKLSGKKEELYNRILEHCNK